MKWGEERGEVWDAYARMRGKYLVGELHGQGQMLLHIALDQLQTRGASPKRLFRRKQTVKHTHLRAHTNAPTCTHERTAMTASSSVESPFWHGTSATRHTTRFHSAL